MQAVLNLSVKKSVIKGVNSELDFTFALYLELNLITI